MLRASSNPGRRDWFDYGFPRSMHRLFAPHGSVRFVNVFLLQTVVVRAVQTHSQLSACGDTKLFRAILFVLLHGGPARWPSFPFMILLSWCSTLLFVRPSWLTIHGNSEISVAI